MSDGILKIPAQVTEDVAGYREHVNEFIAGNTKPVSFKVPSPYRLKGIGFRWVFTNSVRKANIWCGLELVQGL
jgi:hypothetical protein